MKNEDLISEDLTIDQLNLFIKNLEEVRDKKLKVSFPYLDIFKKSTDAGEDGEDLLCNDIFEGLTRVKGKNYDQITEKYIIETKLIRMMTQGDAAYYEKAVGIEETNRGYKPDKKKYGGNISTSTFQQIKPKEFDYLLGVVLFKNGMDIFILPSDKISKTVKKREIGKAYLSGQHKGNNEEGQLNYNDKVLNEHYFLSIYNDGKNLYHYDKENKQIGQMFVKRNIEDIIHEKFNI
jgi:hypothetical protein